ncbi:MAG TPA: hypothetical protein VKP69_02880 [Isosphaeraceae bacterium]|nr:hypothetical protein [Isosphaeraceae bacterium]
MADAVDHDLSGRLMMPQALLLPWAELQLPSRLRIARPRPGA